MYRHLSQTTHLGTECFYDWPAHWAKRLSLRHLLPVEHRSYNRVFKTWNEKSVLRFCSPHPGFHSEVFQPFNFAVIFFLKHKTFLQNFFENVRDHVFNVQSLFWNAQRGFFHRFLKPVVNLSCYLLQVLKQSFQNQFWNFESPPYPPPLKLSPKMQKGARRYISLQNAP